MLDIAILLVLALLVGCALGVILSYPHVYDSMRKEAMRDAKKSITNNRQ